MAESGKRLFEEARADIDGAMKLVGFRRRLNPTEFEDLRSFVMLKLIENDYGRLRKFQHQGSMRAYLNVVVQRLYVDYKIWCVGKWHPSAEAERRGTVAVELERLIYRDGYEPREAIEHASSRNPGMATRDELWQTAYALPVRHRPRHVSDETLYRMSRPLVDPVEARESEVVLGRLRDELGRAFGALEETDRRVLEMRFRDQRTVPEIAAALGIAAKPLYARIRRLLRRVRSRLETAGVGSQQAIELVQASGGAIDLDGVFASVLAA